MENSGEVNYKKDFCERYFDRGAWDLDVLREVDVLLRDKGGGILLYIEAKLAITNEAEHRRALAQTILTNRKQKAVLGQVALIYQDAEGGDTLELIDCSDNSVMFNNDLNWSAERPSSPSRDAIDRINDRIGGRVTRYRGDEIREFYRNLKAGAGAEIEITEKNFHVVYSQWKSEVLFKESVKDEQDLINLFLVDILNGAKYKKSVVDADALDGLKESEQPLIREGTNLCRYEIVRTGGKIRILYEGRENSVFYTIVDPERHAFFWKKYRRPPEKREFLKILERSATLYSDRYRRDTGGEYTPTCFVEKQNEILAKFYDLDEFIVCDPCAGVGNLENQFGRDFKQHCYLSTLEQMDVDICKIKGFENAIQYDYLKDKEQPRWKYRGTMLEINEICKRENRKLMIVMNPPYQRKSGFKYDLVIEFFRKILDLKPDVIVYYTKTEFFLRDTVSVFVDSGYKIRSHIFSNAKTTFQLSRWAISQIIFDKNEGADIDRSAIKADRYEVEKTGFNFKKTYVYNNSRPNLIEEIDKEIKNHSIGLVLGNYSYMNVSINLTNKIFKKSNAITTENLEYCLLSKGINFNTDDKYFERNGFMYKGEVKDIPAELFNDSVMFSLFYTNCAFSNKGRKNYIMPFTAGELGCARNDLNVLFAEDIGGLFDQNTPRMQFDFREFLSRFSFSAEAKALYSAALEVFRFYHRSGDYEAGRDWNDSFYDISNAIMGKDVSSFGEFDGENDRRITRTKTTKGTRGFGRNTVGFAVPSKDLPTFTRFFDARDVLARKINRELLDAGLLLWERENIY